MYVVIVGAGKLGYYLAKDLLSKKYEITLIDWNYERVQKLEPELGGNIIYGCGSSIDGLEKAGCARADVIVAATGHDEDNLIICQLGKRYFNVKKAIARINNPKNERVFKELGVGTTISSTKSVAEAIESYVAQKELRTLLSFNHNEMAVVEIKIQQDSHSAGKQLSQISFPYECSIGFILRGKDVIFPKENIVIEANDLIIAITTKTAQEQLEKAFL